MPYLVTLKKRDDIKIKKSFYYPVNVDLKIIVNNPKKTIRETLEQYNTPGTCGIKGSIILKYKCYQTLFSIMDNQ